MTESAHLIWRLRNERVIQEKGPASLREIHNRWLKQMNNRLSLDCAMRDVMKYDKKAIKMPLVKKTWKKVLKNEHTLSRNWPRDTEVLVGVG
jgi:ribonuclease HI